MKGQEDVKKSIFRSGTSIDMEWSLYHVCGNPPPVPWGSEQEDASASASQKGGRPKKALEDAVQRARCNLLLSSLRPAHPSTGSRFALLPGCSLDLGPQRPKANRA